MKVLVISHNVFSLTDNMGKTLLSYFADFDKKELAQFYIHSQVPTNDKCENYFRVTDKEAIKSMIGIKVGRSFAAADIDHSRIDARTDTGVTGAIYQKARKRTPLIYLARNLWWKISHWNNKQFNKWLNDFNPDCVFLASGDYAFIYDIALKIAKSRKIPLYVSCMDDYYFFNKNADKFLGIFQHRMFMRSVKRTMEYATKLFCICDKMSEEYSKLFGKPSVTVYTPSTIQQPLNFEKKPQISYLGNLGYNRDKQLIEIGKALKSLNLNPNHIDVYSSEKRQEILSGMTEENGIVFHGGVDAQEVIKIIGESLAVIHTESFNDKIRQSVKYSVSTKIADSVASGTCIFAYGPEEIASISYLLQSDAAVCCTSKDMLTDKLCALIQDDKNRELVINNAQALAKNHSIDRTPQIIRNELNTNN